MTSTNGATLDALETLRRQSAHVIALCDAILYGPGSVARLATRQLVPALGLLRSRVQSAIDTVEAQP